jgi:hypothetical protein
VLWLAHESTTVTGTAYEVGVGMVSRVAVGVGESFSQDGELTPELVRDRAGQLGADQLLAPPLGADDRPLTRRLSERAASSGSRT